VRLLDLFCGASGAAVGYARAGFEVTGVDHKPQPHFPFEFIQADALEYLVKHGHEYDAIHASPPCQRYSVLTPVEHKYKHPDLIRPTRECLLALAKPYVIENVPAARSLLVNPVMLCGSMFGLRVWRHRYFEVYPPIFPLLPVCNHGFAPVLISGTPRRNGDRTEPSTQARRDAVGIPWMTGTELDQAIPPAYTEFIGRQLIQAIKEAA